MKAIDWRRVLTDNSIEFIERGKNVKRGQLNVHCPMCGSADPSYHMGLDPDTGWWACWRNSMHRGKSPVRLLVALLKIPYWAAREMAGLDRDYVDPDGFSTVAARLKSTGWSATNAPERAPKVLEMPQDFRHISNSVATRRHMDYLASRGFPDRDLDELAYLYDLRGCTHGYWSYRVIFPYYMDSTLVTWTGRTIADSPRRYQDLSLDDSVLPPKHTLYNHDALLDGGELLIVVEGPVDVAKLDFYGRKHRVRAVGLSTASIQEDQAYLLAAGMAKFNRLAAMMDAGKALDIVASMRMKQQLKFIDSNATIFRPPGGAKDAGEATPEQINQFLCEVL